MTPSNNIQDISIVNGNFIYNGKILFKLTSDSIKQDLEHIILCRPKDQEWNVIPYYDLFEYDNSYGGKSQFKFNAPVKIPAFMPSLLMYVKETGRLPIFTEFAHEYIMNYTEELEEHEIVNRGHLYKNGNDYLCTFVNKYYLFEEIDHSVYFKNTWLRCTNDVSLPLNQVTKLEIIRRIYKAYPSLIRDIYYSVEYAYLGYNSVYSLHKDFQGVDLVVNGCNIGNIVKTNSSNKFYSIKENHRGAEKDKYKLQTSINDDNKISVLNDDELIKLINNHRLIK